MGHSDAKQAAKVGLIANVLDSVSDAQLETMEILSDVEQMTDLMSSLLEAKTGQIVSLQDAFSDI